MNQVLDGSSNSATANKMIDDNNFLMKIDKVKFN